MTAADKDTQRSHFLFGGSQLCGTRECWTVNPTVRPTISERTDVAAHAERIASFQFALVPSVLFIRASRASCASPKLG